ncbi:MAG: Glu/Leu/Phe/Val dehydrogenase [Chloroflexi bacterium]|nr:Glu/Leu/Phe/Val dehydrogenase [Chloroflexota bacterium]
MNILDYMGAYDYEQVVFCRDAGVGLRAIIAIHDTTLGPALGGIRMWPYATEEEALTDVLRLARAMTYKSAAAGLHLGGGKAVIMGDPQRDRNEALFLSFGRFVESLGGRYITTEDVGVTVRDLEWVSQETSHVTGLPIEAGSSGDPSPATAFGVYNGIRACCQEVYGTDSLKGLRIALQGVGKVGYHLAQHLREAGAMLTVADINEAAARRVKEELGIPVVPARDIYDVDCDIFSPCALGGVIHDETIPRLKAKIVAGAANNQLLEGRHGDELARRGILYAPDYVINGGGVINLALELTPAGYDEELAHSRLEGIYDTIQRVIARAKKEAISTARAADLQAEERIAAARRIKRLYLE